MRAFVQVSGIKMELLTVLESLAETDSCISWYHVQYQVFLTKSAMYA